MMNGPEKSDFLVVAKKPANKPETSGAEWAEPRGKAKGNTGEKRTRRTLGRESVFQRLDRVRLAARQKGPSCASPPNTRGKSPVRESRPPGSVRGVSGNGRPYRDHLLLVSAAKPEGGARLSPEQEPRPPDRRNAARPRARGARRPASERPSSGGANEQGRRAP